jgi:hypothetical protein
MKEKIFASPDGASLYRKIIRGAVVVTVGIGGIVVVALIALHLLLDEQLVERRLSEAVRGLPEGVHYRVDVGQVNVSLWGRRIHIEGVALVPEGSHVTDSSVQRYVLTLADLQLHNPGYLSFLWAGDLKFSRVMVDRPMLTILQADGDSAGFSRNPAEFSSSEGGEESSGDKAVPRLEASGVDVRKGRVGIYAAGDRRSWSEGISLAFNNFRVDGRERSANERLLFSEDVQFSADSFGHVTRDGLYRWSTGAVEGSTAEGSLRIDSLRYAPPVEDESFYERVGHRTTRYRLSIRSLRLTELDFNELLRCRAVRAGVAQIESADLEAFVDKRYPDARTSSPMMPHELVQDVDRKIAVDTVRVTGADISYAIRPAEGGSRGVITFTETTGTVSNVVTLPERGSTGPVARFDLSTTVAGDGRLHVDVQIPLLHEELSFEYAGHMTELNPRALNTMFVPNNGLEISGGQADSLWFRATVENGIATGEFYAIYSGLEVRFVNDEEGGQGLAEAVKTLAFRTFKLNAENIPESDDSFRSGNIDHTLETGDSFVKFLWHSLRSGIIDLVATR